MIANISWTLHKNINNFLNEILTMLSYYNYSKYQKANAGYEGTT